MKDTYRILVINPGSTSTRVALYENDRQIFNEKIVHSGEEITKYPSVLDQLDMRVAAIDQMLASHTEEMKELDGVVGRGGLLPGLSPGGYY
ncbi:MAG: butyrate kinase, partial [Lachnospiraceae bacterium]|nr:butyrate kinase [Lachnospiraceae bacterium]